MFRELARMLSSGRSTLRLGSGMLQIHWGQSRLRNSLNGRSSKDWVSTICRSEVGTRVSRRHSAMLSDEQRALAKEAKAHSAAGAMATIHPVAVLGH